MRSLCNNIPPILTWGHSSVSSVQKVAQCVTQRTMYIRRCYKTTELWHDATKTLLLVEKTFVAPPPAALFLLKNITFTLVRDTWFGWGRKTRKGLILKIPDQFEKAGHWPLLTVAEHSPTGNNSPTGNIRSILSIEIQTHPQQPSYNWKNNRGKENTKVQIPRPEICPPIYYFHIGKDYSFILSMYSHMLWSLFHHLFLYRWLNFKHAYKNALHCSFEITSNFGIFYFIFGPLIESSAKIRSNLGATRVFQTCSD